MPYVVGPRSGQVTGRQGTAARSRKRTAGSGDARGRPTEYVRIPDQRSRRSSPSSHVRHGRARAGPPRAPLTTARPSKASGATPRRRSPGTGAVLTPAPGRGRAPRPKPRGALRTPLAQVTSHAPTPRAHVTQPTRDSVDPGQPSTAFADQTGAETDRPLPWQAGGKELRSEGGAGPSHRAATSTARLLLGRTSASSASSCFFYFFDGTVGIPRNGSRSAPKASAGTAGDLGSTGARRS